MKHKLAYLGNQWSNCFHIWYVKRLWWPNSESDLLTSVWLSRSKIVRGQKVGQSETFSNHGLWHTKMTGIKSRMQICHSCLPNFPYFGDICHFVFSLCYQIWPDLLFLWPCEHKISAILYSPNVIQWCQIHEYDEVPCQLFPHIWSILIVGESIDSVTWCIYTMLEKWPLTLETRSLNVKERSTNQ